MIARILSRVTWSGQGKSVEWTCQASGWRGGGCGGSSPGRVLESLIQLVLWVIHEFSGNTSHLYQDADGGQAE
jgi:hypothetical protein